jgi:hypothetical protein
MSEIDLLLRETLQDQAEEAPGANGLLTRVQARSRRLRRRRAGLAGAGIAAAVLVASGTPAAVHLFAGSTPRGADTGGPANATASAGPSKTFASEPAPPEDRESIPPDPSYAPFPVRLGPPSYSLPGFPLVPATNTVAGLAPPVALMDGQPRLYHPPAGEGQPTIEVRFRAQKPAFDARDVAPGGEQVLVRGIDATMLVGSGGAANRYLYWLDPSGAWILVSASGVDGPTLVKYADSLRPGNIPMTAPFTFQTLPRGLELDQVGPSDMVFRTPDAPPGGSYIGRFVVMLNTDVSGEPATWPLRVDGRPASIIQQDGGRSLQVLLSEGRHLVIQVPANILISDEDLKQIAAGTTVADGVVGARG